MKKDRDLVSTLQGADQAFVCFRPAEDIFLTVSYSKPASTEYTKTSTGSMAQAPGMVFYSRYKNGVLDDSEYAGGTWRRFPRQTDETFISPAKQEVRTTITDNEVDVYYAFQNLRSTETDYSLQIRRSTLRFTENYTWVEQPQKTRPKTSAQRPTRDSSSETRSRDTINGYCAEFANPSSPTP